MHWTNTSVGVQVALISHSEIILSSLAHTSVHCVHSESQINLTAFNITAPLSKALQRELTFDSDRAGNHVKTGVHRLYTFN